MNKKQVQKRVTQGGEPLDLDSFEWDEDANVFSTTESNLVLDFSDINCVTFTTGSDCTFTTGSDCTFKTDSGCTFKTDSGCTFNTGPWCTFDTSSDCVFTTGPRCTFNTGSGCTFDTSYNCVFTTGSGCTFDTGKECVVVRRDMYEVIELKEGVEIKLNDYCIKGYEIIGEDVEITLNGHTYKLID